jgi:hypothetical protein
MPSLKKRTNMPIAAAWRCTHENEYVVRTFVPRLSLTSDQLLNLTDGEDCARIGAVHKLSSIAEIIAPKLRNRGNRGRCLCARKPVAREFGANFA